MSSTGREALGLSVGDSVTVETIVPTAPDVETARNESGIAETIDRDGTNLLIAAPHAGNIEPGSGDIAERIQMRLREHGAGGSYWCLYTFGTNTFDRYHIHSSNLDPAAYPKLRRIADERYELALSVHGHSEEYISVGGTAPQRSRRRLANILADQFSNADVRFRHDEGKNMGTSEKNFVNWLVKGSTGGIQLEIPWRYRQNNRQQVVDGVVAGLKSLLSEPD